MSAEGLAVIRRTVATPAVDTAANALRPSVLCRQDSSTRLLTGPSPRNTAEARHATISLLDDAGSTIEDISALVRHKKSQVARIVYGTSNAPAARPAAAMDAIDLAASGETHDQSRRLPG
jgi:hypothetical protein